MKLKVYQEGGGLIYTPYLRERSTTSITKSKDDDSSSEEQLDPLDKEILGLMKDQNLLPSDIEMITNSVIAFQKRTQHLSALPGSGNGYYRSVMPGMLQIMNMVSVAKANKETWDNRVAEMKKHDAGSEVAMDSYGRMWVQDVSSGKLNRISPSEFDREKYIPVSNSQLLFLRQRELGFQDNLIDDTGMDLIGAKDLHDDINDKISKIGKVTSSNYVVKKFKDIANDLQGEGIFKVISERSKADLADFSELIFSELSDDSKHLLTARAAIMGLNPKNYLSSIIFGNISQKDEEASYEGTLTKAAGLGGAGGSGSEPLTQDNYLIQIGNLQGDRTKVAIYPRAKEIGDTAALEAPAVTFGRVIDRSNNPVETTSVASLLRDGWAFAAGTPGSVTFGNKIMNPQELEALMFDETSNLTAVMLPYKIENGHIVPDFDAFDKFNQLQKALDDNQDLTNTEKLQIAKNLQIDPKSYSIENNTVKIIDTMAFLTVSAYAGDDTVDLTSENKRYLEKVDRKDGKHLKDFYNNMVKYGKLRPAKKGIVEIKGYSKSEANDFWRGNIYIPIKNAYYSLLLSGIGQFVPKSQMNNYYGRVAAREAEVAAQRYTMATDPNYEYNRTIGQFRDE